MIALDDTMCALECAAKAARKPKAKRERRKKPAATRGWPHTVPQPRRASPRARENMQTRGDTPLTARTVLTHVTAGRLWKLTRDGRKRCNTLATPRARLERHLNVLDNAMPRKAARAACHLAPVPS